MFLTKVSYCLNCQLEHAENFLPVKNTLAYADKVTESLVTDTHLTEILMTESLIWDFCHW